MWGMICVSVEFCKFNNESQPALDLISYLTELYTITPEQIGFEHQV